VEELIRRFIENGFADFEGMQISGTVPVQQEIINEVIAATLRGEIPIPGASASSEGGGASRSGDGRPKMKLPLPELLKMVQRADVQAQEGRIIINFEVRR
jgi:hypothetical protein